jgi:uncharacterized pyridoxal phosphate-containing UPF0001 family protein
LITIRFTKLVAYDNTPTNNYFYSITFNSPFKILQLEKKVLNGNSYVGLSGYSYLVLIVFYMITVVLILKGLMAVAPLDVAPDLAFGALRTISGTFLKAFPDATWVSAGMSGDFAAAIASGATHIRIGSSILGSRT